jgi:hypothetical protein
MRLILSVLPVNLSVLLEAEAGAGEGFVDNAFDYRAATLT